MPKTKSSRRWLKEHFDDEYVKKAKQQGYRSRAVYKLLELDERDHILPPGRTVVDLGAAPGGWAQLAAERVGRQGRVFALDILPMESLPGVIFVQGDFTGQKVVDELSKILVDMDIGLVMSDMAPNITGVNSVDQPRAMYLAELALEFARERLALGGDFVAKVFQGAGFEQFHKEVRSLFQQTNMRKPKASRARTNEVYVVAKNYYGRSTSNL